MPAPLFAYAFLFSLYLCLMESPVLIALRRMMAESAVSPGAAVLAAVSGGPDSVALALALQACGYAVQVAHMNFSLRPTADAEQEWVRQWAARCGFPFHTRTVDTSATAEAEGQSIQEAARHLRYAWFESLLAESACEWIATGHHAGDEAETIVLNLLRSQHPAVLRGIPPQRGRILRPLLGLPKETLLDFLRAQGQDWLEDESNADPKYDRNFIRHEVMPALQVLNPQAEAQLISRLHKYELQQQLLSQLLDREPGLFTPGSTDVPAQLWLNEGAARLGEAALPLLVDHFFQAQVPGPFLRAMHRLITAAPGRIALGEGLRAVRERDHLALHTMQAAPSFEHVVEAMPQQAVDLALGAKLVTLEPAATWPGPGGPVQVHYLDADRIEWPLRLRPWREGDRMQPLGMEGHRLLSDIFTTLKWTAHQKSQALIFEDRSQILCLSGFRIAAQVSVTAASQHFLKITIA